MDIRVVSQDNMRCTTLTLKAFGISLMKEAKTGIDVLTAFKRNGYDWNPLVSDCAQLVGRPLSEVLPILQALGGDYYIPTAGHAMAFKGGVLFDTAQGGLRRKVIGVYLITARMP